MRVPPPLNWRRIEPAEAEYPALLKEVKAAPGLDVAGELRAADEVVAIVGSRLSSPYGEDVAYEMAAELASAGFVVASGLARGIDACAHRGALDAGGRTIAVMGTGRDRVYPPEHFYLARRIAEQGALVTQFREGTAPLASNFPSRNQTLSGLSLGVVVVEAKRRSGAMLTAGSAADQGRLVMAVPGSIYSPTSVGCHELLRDGAHLVSSAEEVVQEVRRDPLFRLLDVAPKTEQPPAYGDLRDDLMRVLRSHRLSLDQICGRTQRPAREVAMAAAQLRLDGAITLRDGLYSANRHRYAVPSRSAPIGNVGG
ncbi:MAG TPA: DNA-processing protein DprA [Candidatus Solibacter sp.]|jgi:DNA processing protein|nr:DNA-processing protein DprA [Candidatus Solibacter sp.]